MKRVIDYFRHQVNKGKTQNTAALAKERLQIIIAHERGQENREHLLTNLKEELITVVAKHLKIARELVSDQIKVDLEHREEHSILELNITIPDQENPQKV